MRKDIRIVIYFLIIIFIATLAFWAFRLLSITGNTVISLENNYTYTKAICNKTGYCEDYEISCVGGSVRGVTSTGFSIQTGKDWKDPRDNETINNFC